VGAPLIPAIATKSAASGYKSVVRDNSDVTLSQKLQTSEPYEFRAAGQTAIVMPLVSAPK
jgi:hypothetical protein